MKFKDALLSVLIIEVGVAILAVINYGATLETLQAVTRFSGRASLGIFSLIFLFQTHRFVKLKNILSEKYFLIFAIAHGIHLLQLLAFIIASGNELIPIRLAGGMLAYTLIFLMPYIQYLAESGRINESHLKRINLIYLYYVWFVFFMTYYPRVSGSLPITGGTYKEFVILLAWVMFMLGIKISSLLKHKSISRR
ncbi:MAG: hypothetical protein MUF39_06410 [Cyclobacteriaceae bacterium]|jgi:hypothetical protein|nr:hypothetical protein [Bacteroidia bacterium]MCU0368445.1 hypothetical protein [Cyclobacteriaceae bacterium]